MGAGTRGLHPAGLVAAAGDAPLAGIHTGLEVSDSARVYRGRFCARGVWLSPDGTAQNWDSADVAHGPVNPHQFFSPALDST